MKETLEWRAAQDPISSKAPTEGGEVVEDIPKLEVAGVVGVEVGVVVEDVVEGEEAGVDERARPDEELDTESALVMEPLLSISEMAVAK